MVQHLHFGEFAFVLPLKLGFNADPILRPIWAIRKSIVTAWHFWVIGVAIGQDDSAARRNFMPPIDCKHNQGRPLTSRLRRSKSSKPPFRVGRHQGQRNTKTKPVRIFKRVMGEPRDTISLRYGPIFNAHIMGQRHKAAPCRSKGATVFSA